MVTLSSMPSVSLCSKNGRREQFVASGPPTWPVFCRGNPLGGRTYFIKSIAAALMRLEDSPYFS